MAKPCPLCGGTMERHVDLIEYPAISRHMELIRLTRLGAFWACNHCEHCEEIN